MLGGGGRAALEGCLGGGPQEMVPAGDQTWEKARGPAGMTSAQEGALGEHQGPSS